MAKRLTRDEMILALNDVMNPEGFSSEEINQKLLMFAGSCPDPAAAMDMVIDDMEPATAAEFVDRALAMPARDPRTLPISELHRDHPLRHMNIEP